MRLLPILLLIQAAAGSNKPSSKKGLCIPPGEKFHCGDLEAFPRATWWYNWHTRPNHEVTDHDYCTCETAPDCGPEPDMPAFIPMIWGFHEEGWWHDDESDPVADKYPIVLGFNEPNHADQSDLSPQVAAEGWMEIQILYPDKILVSPAPAGGNTNWFDQFFEICGGLGCRIDYLATHDYAGDTDAVMDKLEMLYNRYGRKIWLTEFAKCCTRDLAEVEHFARSIIPRLEAAEYVHRYSWFITRYTDTLYEGGRLGEGQDWEREEDQDEDWYLDKVNALFVPGTNELSSVGRIYNNL